MPEYFVTYRIPSTSEIVSSGSFNRDAVRTTAGDHCSCRSPTIAPDSTAATKIPVPGAVTVIVVPDGDEPAPVPTEGTLRTVCALLDQRRLLTTEVFVVAPRTRR